MRRSSGLKEFLPLIERLLLIPIAIVLIAIAVVNLFPLHAKSGKPTYDSELNTIQLAVAAFYADVQDGWNPSSGQWGDNSGATILGNYYPTKLAKIESFYLSTTVNAFDPEHSQNPLVTLANGAPASDVDIWRHAIWMGLLLNRDGNVAPGVQRGGVTDPADPGTSSIDRFQVTPLLGRQSRYLSKLPKSAMFGMNGDPKTGKSGSYAWVVGLNGRVYGCYKVVGVVPVRADGRTEALPYGTYWFSGFSGAYP
jgi:hypothetical protein